MPEANINKALKGTTLNHSWAEAQQRLTIHDGSLSTWFNHHEQKHSTRIKQ